MNNITLVCTRSAINASALTYMINQSPDYYHNVHNDVWLKEVSEKFGTAHTINDWWNVPNDFSSYTRNVRNADVLSLQQLEQITDQAKDINIEKNIALFTHATNHSMIQKWIDTYNLPMNIVTTVMGNHCHHYVASWLKREYNHTMNDWQDQQQAWDQLSKQRIKDAEWESRNTVSIYEWLNNPSDMFAKLNIKYPVGIDVWLKEYCYKNDILYDFDADQYWENLGNITKLTVFMWLLNKVIQENPKKALAYSEKLYTIQQDNKSAHWRIIDKRARQTLGLTTS